MGLFIVIAVVLVVALGVRRLVRGRTAPRFDQKNLENANYARTTQEVTYFDRRDGHI